MDLSPSPANGLDSLRTGCGSSRVARDDKIVRNVAGTATVNAAELQYRYSEPYISKRSNEEDLSAPVMSAAAAILAQEAEKSRTWRIALFDKREVHDAMCLASFAAPSRQTKARCPLKLSLSPQPEATIPGAVWSKSYTEQEAIDEKHLPTLVQLLTLDNSHLVDRDRAFALFMDLANSPEILATVARKSSILSASQFDELIKRILASPGCGNEAVTVLSKVNRLTEEHRRELRTKISVRRAWQSSPTTPRRCGSLMPRSRSWRHAYAPRRS